MYLTFIDYSRCTDFQNQVKDLEEGLGIYTSHFSPKSSAQVHRENEKHKKVIEMANCGDAQFFKFHFIILEMIHFL